MSHCALHIADKAPLNRGRCVAHRSRHSRRALTLPELMITLAIAAVMALAAGLVIDAGARISVTERRRTDAQRDAAVALRTIQAQVRSRTADQVSVNTAGDRLTLVPPSGPSRSFSLDNGSLIFNNGAGDISLVSGGVQSLSFELVPGHRSGQTILNTTLQLSAVGESIQAQTSTTLRN